MTMTDLEADFNEKNVRYGVYQAGAKQWFKERPRAIAEMERLSRIWPDQRVSVTEHHRNGSSIHIAHIDPQDRPTTTAFRGG